MLGLKGPCQIGGGGSFGWTFKVAGPSVGAKVKLRIPYYTYVKDATPRSRTNAPVWDLGNLKKRTASIKDQHAEKSPGKTTV